MYFTIWEEFKGKPPDFWIPQISRCIFIIITIFPSITCSSFQLGSVTIICLQELNAYQDGNILATNVFKYSHCYTQGHVVNTQWNQLSFPSRVLFVNQIQACSLTIMTLGPIVTSGLRKWCKAVMAPILQQSVRFPLSSRILISTRMDQT